jgi:3-oxoacyl-[acyl-carrier protein] reductase
LTMDASKIQEPVDGLAPSVAATEWALVPDLSGQVALVTGGSRGIGRQISLALGAVGAQVVIAARGEADMAAVVAEIGAKGGRAVAIAADLSRKEDVMALFARLQEQFGRLDVLVNDAGIAPIGALADVPIEEFDALVALNLRGAFLCCQQGFRMMKSQRSGYIINISSISGIKGYLHQGAYGATKHGLMGLTKVLALEAQEYGIRVSAILPGAVDSPMAAKGRPDLIGNPTLLQPTDVARAVLFLLSLPERAVIDQIHLRRYASTPFPA